MSMNRRVNVPLLSLILMGRNVTVIVLGWEKLTERPDQIDTQLAGRRSAEGQPT